MKTYFLKVFVGPTIVKQMAEKFIEAGLNGVHDGTEHVYWNIKAVDAYVAYSATIICLELQHYTSFGIQMNDVRIVRVTE